MTIDLSHFGLAEMLRCGTGLRKAVQGAPTMETAAAHACRFLYDELVGAESQRACALVRCYKTHAYGALDGDLQRFARRALGPSDAPTAEMKCLTLLATAGKEASWNSRRASRGHRAIPLLSSDMVAQAPMVSQLILQFGLKLADVVRPSPDLVGDLEGKSYGVFHVEDARGSPYIPAQADFVDRYGIRSVVGFGGSLPSGDLFAIILFSRVSVDAEAAARFRRIALDLKAHFFPFTPSQIFDPAPRSGPSSTTSTVSA
ncbi:MAG: hypothetical protein NVS9B3_07260 [Gemmatimonadaceae bacterium]